MCMGSGNGECSKLKKSRDEGRKEGGKEGGREGGHREGGDSFEGRFYLPVCFLRMGETSCL